jgi:transposase InsO family protein
MIDRTHPLPVVRQVKLVGISRSSAYYAPSPVSAADLALMRRIDELHLEHPFAGARMLMRLLKREGIAIGRKHVGTLMRKMGIEALYRKPNLSRKHLAHKIWPYLLRDRKIERSNQVFALDTTYVPMAQGFVYLTAVIDWASRRVLAHRVAITMEAEHAVAALEEAFAKYGLPEIVNTDRQPVHQYRLHRRGPLAWDRSVDGRQGKLAGQRFYRTAVAQREVRRSVFEGLRICCSRKEVDRPLPDVVQVRFILPNLAMSLINLESPVVSLVLWGVRAVREPGRRVR